LKKDDLLADMAWEVYSNGLYAIAQIRLIKSGRKYKTNSQKRPIKKLNLKARKDILVNEVDPIKAESV